MRMPTVAVEDTQLRRQTLAKIVIRLRKERKPVTRYTLQPLLKEEGFDVSFATIYRDLTSLNQSNTYVRDLAESNYSAYQEEISESNKGHTSWMKGKNHSTETRLKISKAGFGRIVSEETKKKMSNCHLGKFVSKETRQKLSLLRSKQKFPLQDTKPERIFQIALSIENIQYLKHKPFKVNSTYHQVDIFIQPNICIEIDGCYWHSCKQCGFNYPPRIEKDKLINESLQSQGYTVLRFWEHEIKKDVSKCIEKIKSEIKKSKTKTAVSA